MCMYMFRLTLYINRECLENIQYTYSKYTGHTALSIHARKEEYGFDKRRPSTISRTLR